MNSNQFPYLACAIATVLMLVALRGSQPGADGSTQLPLLTLLLICEFAFIVTLTAVITGLRQQLRDGFTLNPALATGGCLIYAVGFLLLGLRFWPDAPLLG